MERQLWQLQLLCRIWTPLRFKMHSKSRVDRICEPATLHAAAAASVAAAAAVSVNLFRTHTRTQTHTHSLALPARP